VFWLIGWFFSTKTCVYLSFRIFPSEEEYEDKSWAVLDFIHLDLKNMYFVPE